MAAPNQYIVDFTSPEALKAVLNEYFAVGVVPVSSDTAPKAMTTVKLQVFLPLERELFFTGVVIMLRPGGFLVQLDTPPDMGFLNGTLRDAAISHTREAAPAPKPVGDNIFDGAAADPLRTTARTERMGALTDPGHRQADDSDSRQTGDRGGTIFGHSSISAAAKAVHAAQPAGGGDETEAPATARREKTRPGVRKPPRPVPGDEPPIPDDEFDISISAVDTVTGQPISSRAKTGRHKRPSFETYQFGRDPAPIDEDIPVLTEAPPVTQTRRQEYHDVNRTSKMKALKPEIPQPASTVDELFEMAATAGGTGLIDAISGPSPELATDDDTADGRTRAIRTPIDRDSMPDQEDSAPSEQDPQDPDPFDDDKSGQLDRELAVSIREMTVPEKQRLARQGRRIARRILIRDNDKTVHKFVFFNPEVKVDEVVEYTRSNSLASDAIEFICTNKQWMESHDVILNIVRNNSTPLELAVRFVTKLTQNDWRMLARPGAARPAIMNQARRLLQGCE